MALAHNFVLPKMTTDISSSANECVQIHQHQHDSIERVMTAPNADIATSLAAATVMSKRRGTVRATTTGTVSSSGSRTKQCRQSIKFSNKIFVTKWAGDLEKDYIMGKLLGGGAYGSVYACTHRETGAERAVKVIPKSPDAAQNDMVIREFNVLKELDHPNVLKIYALYETDTHFHIVSDRIRGGELYDLLEQEFTEDDVRSLMKALLGALNYCHIQGIVHRDLKPENILLEDNRETGDFSQIKVIDFGLAEFFGGDNGEHFTEAAGSSYYMSPQVLERKYTSKCDIWSAGIIAFVCLGGYAPFSGEDEMETAQLILDGEQVFFDDPAWDAISDDALDFIEFLLTYDEDKRPTAGQALQHKWLQAPSTRLSLNSENDLDETARSSFASLRSFHCADSKLKQCTYSLIASQIVRKEDKQHLDEMFRMLDVDCDGQISDEDMMTIYNERFGVELGEEDVAGIIYEVNISGSGAITYSEFVIASLLEKGILVTDQNIELAFQMMDKNQTGYLTFDNLKDVLGVDDDMEPYVRERIISPADRDGDGKISLQDFNAFFASDQQNTQPVSTALESGRNTFRRSACARRSTVRKSFRASVLLREDEMARFRDENSSMMMSSSVLGSSIGEPTFKSLLQIFENQIQDNAANGGNALPSMFSQEES